MVFVRRQDYIETLYNSIEDKSKIRFRTGVVSFSEAEHGIRVTTDNGGESIEGSVLVGADGVNSTIRALMAQSLKGEHPGASESLTKGMSYCGHHYLSPYLFSPFRYLTDMDRFHCPIPHPSRNLTQPFPRKPKITVPAEWAHAQCILRRGLRLQRPGYPRPRVLVSSRQAGGGNELESRPSIYGCRLRSHHYQVRPSPARGKLYVCHKRLYGAARVGRHGCSVESQRPGRLTRR